MTASSSSLGPWSASSNAPWRCNALAQKRATALDPLENSIGRERPAGCAKILLDFCGYREATRYACLRCELLVLSFIALVAQNGETSTVRYIAMQNFIGVWKLVEARAFDDDGHEVPSPMGPEPMGWPLR